MRKISSKFETVFKLRTPTKNTKLINVNNGQHFYKESSECPGNLKWSRTATTIIGNGYGSGFNQLSLPTGLFLEPKTQILYISDNSNNRIQKRYPNGEIKTAAGQANGTGGTTADTLWNPVDVFADENENVFVADWSNQRIQFWKKNAKSGRTVAGNGTRGSALNEFSYPSRVLLDSKKNIIVADTQNERITRWPSTFDPRTSVGTIMAGGNGAGLNPDQLNNPFGLYYDEPNQIFYISNHDSHSITQWFIGDYEPHNIYAGIPGRFGNSSAQLFYPEGITLDSYGNLYVADCQNNRIQMFCPNSVFGITIAGNGQSGNSSYELSFPGDVAFDSELNLYVSDTFNNRIQKFQRIQ
ncbi:unnamed protein product [Rotaria sordida]|uniref:NHL repeat containing protein n=2 Tax=Rotaria sordida TaxID=392033 RepID=A0A814NQQ9_9BILA|nr:unnamed protein product [Rotaria sordida]CAF1096541.1 unnamed protein product [Rotaria sordida]